MKVRTKVQAGGSLPQHNETLVHAARKARGVKVKTRVKAAGTTFQHNEILVRERARRERSPRH